MDMSHHWPRTSCPVLSRASSGHSAVVALRPPVATRQSTVVARQFSARYRQSHLCVNDLSGQDNVHQLATIDTGRAWVSSGLGCACSEFQIGSFTTAVVHRSVVAAKRRYTVCRPRPPYNRPLSTLQPSTVHRSLSTATLLRYGSCLAQSMGKVRTIMRGWEGAGLIWVVVTSLRSHGLVISLGPGVLVSDIRPSYWLTPPTFSHVFMILQTINKI